MALDFLGGEVGDTRQAAYGVPEFVIGDRAVLFMSSELSSDLITGEMFRYFPINRAPDGTDYVTLPSGKAFSSIEQIDEPATISTQPLVPMSLDAFSVGVRELLAGGSTAVTTSAFREGTVAEGDFGFGDPGIPGRALIPFPPRDQALDFFLVLDDTYRDTLGRQQDNPGFVDAEGSAVWFQEWLRYVLNQCSVTEAANRVIMQIRGQGIQPVCGSAPEGVIAFPPRDQSLDFLSTLDTFYRDELNRSEQLSHIDLEGKAVWLQEYLRYRVNGYIRISQLTNCADEAVS